MIFRTLSGLECSLTGFTSVFWGHQGQVKLENIDKNCGVIRKLLSDIKKDVHIEKVNFKPLVISPLNLVPKSNCSPKLIHNLKTLNTFVKRDASVKHLNVRTSQETMSL